MFRTGRYDGTAAQQDHLTLSRKYSVKAVRPASKIEAVTGAALCFVRLCKCKTEEANFKPVELIGKQCVLCALRDLGYSRKDKTDIV